MLYDIDKKRSRHNTSFWGDYAEQDFFDDLPMARKRNNSPAINIIENTSEFVMELISPGMCKQNYHMEVENDVLTISGKYEEQSKDKNYTRREFKPTSFSKTFLLPESVDTDKIAASCADGILTVNIPKKEEAYLKNRRDIEVS